MSAQDAESRAMFLRSAYKSDPNPFDDAHITPDQMLVEEYGELRYLDLVRQNLVPIVALPDGVIVLEV